MTLRPSAVPYFRNFGLIVAAVAALLILPWMGMNAGLTVEPELAGLDSEGAYDDGIPRGRRRPLITG